MQIDGAGYLLSQMLPQLEEGKGKLKHKDDALLKEQKTRYL